MNIRGMIAVVTLLTATRGARAQYRPTLSQDSDSGTYTISYIDETGTSRSVRFIGPDQVDPRVVVQIEIGAVLRYGYGGIGNGARARLRMLSIDVPCEEKSNSPSRRPRMKLWNSVRARLPGPMVYYCGWLLFDQGADPGVRPGGRLERTLTLQSSWLPGIREGRATGATEEVVFPGFRDEAPESIHSLFWSTQHPRVFSIVSPKYPPAAFADPTAGVSVVLVELTQACALGWIGKERDDDRRASDVRQNGSDEPDEPCSELTGKLQRAQKDLALGKKAKAAHQLQEFLHEISQQESKRVNANARALLSTDVSYLLTKVLGVIPEKDD